MLLKFSVTNQKIERMDCFYVVAKSRNFLWTLFDFKTDNWMGAKKAIFNHKKMIEPKEVELDENNMCLIPWEWLDVDEFTRGQVSVYGGDLLTTDIAVVSINESGYKPADQSEPQGTGDYEQLKALVEKHAGNNISVEKGVHGFRYWDSKLERLEGDKWREITLGGGTDSREIELRVTLTHIQWRHIEEKWIDLIPLIDLKGKNGKSAYELWLDNGYDGSVSEFIKRLDGRSAYQVWLDAGHTGSEADFLISLIGKQGPPGTQFKVRTKAEFEGLTIDSDTFYFIKKE